MTKSTLDRQAGIAFEYLHSDFRLRPSGPERGAVHHPVPKRPTVRSIAACHWARDAHEFGSHLIGAEANRRIAVTAKVDEHKVRRELRVRQRTGAGHVEALRVFQARAD